MKPALFDGIELVVDLLEDNLKAGTRGAVVEDFGDDEYEVEFANSDGETLALCTLTPEQFIVVWRAETKSWTSASKQARTS
ncbi:MAG: DUF4926 domain-containing protein [Phormidesmis sp. CAN_BIN44]|nr:DUF4926 domain-containing protein [Phormidesmis sp. CAN_BIN44]